MKDAMEAFKKSNGCYPKQVIFLRDGVGDKQMQAIMKDEIEQIRAAFRRTEETKDTKILFMMINKRVKTKLLQSNGRYDNP